ncbi:NUDIX hydrolase [Roseivirga misakiensis]|uniref:DNA mismatch repair protein MutT n=1 Tax=Roseivirga misakiensis TaxID=1563681 RepID=A0A1E5T571_9BACT|nr:NUDIX domain-containing protein [Roseivirga misakiensis]OEK06521.1 DNA mismatch repair protein MutT [Roseivirga misakiensis]
MKVIDKLAWLEIKDNRILVARSKGKEAFYIPGGKRELGESDAQALIREIDEELSVKLHEDSLAYYGTFSAQAHGHADGVLVQMTCYMGQYDGELKAAAEIEEVSWLEFEEMDKTSHVDKIIFKDLRSKNLL